MSTTYESVLKDSSKNKAALFAIKNIYPAYIILVIALAASIALWQFTKNKVESDNLAEFEKATFSIESRIQAAVDEHAAIARSMKGLYDINPYVVRDMFELYGSIPVKTYPAIRSVGFATRVPASDLNNHIRYAQSERYWTYSIHPTGSRPLYYPVLYLVPLEKNLSISGYDLYSRKEMEKAIQKAGSNDLLTTTTLFPLRGDSLPGFVFIAPVFNPADPFGDGKAAVSEENLNGVVFIEVIASSLFSYALGSGEATDKLVMFSITDEEGNVIFSSENSGKYDSPMFSTRKSVELLDKNLLIEVATVKNFGEGFSATMPLISLVGSLLTSFLLFGFTVSTLTGRARAQAIADKITESQRRIVDTSRDIIGITSIDGVWKTINPAATVIFGYVADEFIGRSMLESMGEQYSTKLRKLIAAAAEDDKIMVEVEMPTRDGEDRWISWNISVSKEDGLLYMIGRDVTEQKLAEEQIKLRSRQVEIARQFTNEAANYQSRFMTDVSFFFRTSLTGIIGYLELLLQKQYSSEEDLEFFVTEAYTSAEQLLSRTSDLLDVADSDSEGSDFIVKSVSLPPKDTFEAVERSVREAHSDITFTFDGAIEVAPEYTILADKEQLHFALVSVIEALTVGVEEAKIDYMVQANTYENVMEIQLLITGSTLASDIISTLAKTPKDKIIEALAQDKENILFRIAEAASRLRTMSASLQVDSLGNAENVAMIALPLKKSISLASLKARKKQ